MAIYTISLGCLVRVALSKIKYMKKMSMKNLGIIFPAITGHGLFGHHIRKWKKKTMHLHICWMNFVTMHSFMPSHKIVAKMTENCETTENLDSNATKL